MKIETKFNVGDEVTMSIPSCGDCMIDKIRSIEIEIGIVKNIIRYKFGVSTFVCEQNLMSIKEWKAGRRQYLQDELEKLGEME